MRMQNNEKKIKKRYVRRKQKNKRLFLENKLCKFVQERRFIVWVITK